MSSDERTYHVSKGEQTLGPWTMKELSQRLAKNEVAVTDFVFDEATDDWVTLMDFAPLKAFLANTRPKGRPQKQVEEKVAPALEPRPTLTLLTPENANTAEWFVQKGHDRYGPFTYLALVRAMQEKTMYGFDLVWREGMKDWMRLAEHEAFSPEAIQKLTETAKSAPGVFLSRRFPRVRFEREILVHDNNRVWVGRAFEASAGGSGIIIENSTLMPGQTISVHFSAAEGLQAFNAVCEIVNKRYSKDVRDASSAVTYSVRFVKIETSAESKVQSFFLGENRAA